eukprot:14491937-Heterocapsa_arctica.AAC.1
MDDMDDDEDLLQAPDQQYMNNMNDGDDILIQPATQLDMDNTNIRLDELFSQLRDAQHITNTIQATLALLGSGDNSTTTASSALQIV